eukprot:7582554-Heterocapsa_arctica.AAC.2
METAPHGASARTGRVVRTEPGARERVRPNVDTRDFMYGPHVETSDLINEVGPEIVTIKERVRAAVLNNSFKLIENHYDDCGEDYSQLDVDESKLPAPTLLSVCFGDEDEPEVEHQINALDIEQLYDDSFLSWWMLGSGAETVEYPSEYYIGHDA